jgi:hypothetical protein
MRERNSTTMLLMVAVLALTAASAFAQPRVGCDEPVFDFGHLGVDYTAFHNFRIYNRGDQPLVISSAAASCDCSSARLLDTLLMPGDTTIVRLSFGTEKYFGPTRQWYTIKSNDPVRPEFNVYYESVIGQWVPGMKPEPLSLFFLPGHSGKTVTISNPTQAETKASLVDQADTIYTVEIVVASADRGEALKVKVTPAEGIAAGTYESSFRLQIQAEGREDPVVLSIPLKIVRY